MAVSVPGNSCMPECVLQLNSKCVTYNGNTISPVGIIKFTNLNDVIQAIANAIIAIPPPTPPTTTLPWGSITGTLSNQTDLANALSLLAPLNSPSLTGSPTAPTQILGDNTTKIATTAFVTAAVALKTIAWGTITGTLSAQTDLQNALNLKANTSALATVAFSGSYPDLINKPTIVNTFNTRSGTVTLSSADVIAALGFTPVPATDIQIFAVGVSTWTKPAGAKMVKIFMVSGGCGGAGGGCQLTNAINGGGAGGGSGTGVIELNASLVGATETVTVAAGGAGGAGTSTPGATGGTGVAPIITSFGTWLRLSGIALQTGGPGFPQNAGGGIGTFGSNGGGGGGAGTTVSGSGASGGGGGGNMAASGVLGAAPGSGGSVGAAGTATSGVSFLAGGTAGSTSVGGNGNSRPANSAFTGGSGGGGGSANATGNGFKGGDGGFPGGGGGGGGACANGFTSGAGGKGGDGIIIVITYF